MFMYLMTGIDYNDAMYKAIYKVYLHDLLTQF